MRTKHSENLLLDNGRRVTVTIYDSVDFNWESMLYPDNQTTFAVIESGDEKVVLTTAGSVRIFDDIDKILYNNDNVPEQVLEEIRNGTLDTSSRYTVWENNWFTLDFATLIDDEWHFVDDVVYENESTTIENLVNDMITTYTWFHSA